MEAAAERELKYETAIAVGRLVLTLFLLVALVSFLGWRYRDELTRFGDWFVHRFGLGGMMIGTILADGLHFPIPPQFYLLTGIAAGHGGIVTFSAVLLGSEIGSFVAFSLGRNFSRSRFVEKHMARPSALLQRFLDRQGYVGLAVAALLPISWCVLCATAGAMQLPYRAFAVLGGMRIPKLLITYAFLAWAWQS